MLPLTARLPPITALPVMFRALPVTVPVVFRLPAIALPAALSVPPVEMLPPTMLPLTVRLLILLLPLTTNWPPAGLVITTAVALDVIVAPPKSTPFAEVYSVFQRLPAVPRL